ncbi:MGMT family protein [Bhargavaea beijingensis]|uniref:DNA methyltransferase n=1 Tax=Bhargavaea beijingensis TaxID=426756 RepID=A0ABX9ZDZ3_9BACL|nr:MGMT family protein [Bhargavaea beijingensis]RSK34297.1 DNA methyltransferase [Bhargavaea beijingensis]
MEDFTERVVKLLKEVPAGTVASYGQIARLAGNPGGARHVSRILHSMSRKHGIPWHRIVNAKGEIVISDGEAAFEQEERLREEGVPVIGGKRVDMERYRWHPGFGEEE